MTHDEFAKSVIGSVWVVEYPWEDYMPLFLVVGYDWVEQWVELKVLNLFTGELRSCPFDSGQRKGDNHWAIFYPFNRYGPMCALIRRNDL